MTMLLPSIHEIAEANSRYQRRVHGEAIARREQANRPWHPSEMDTPTWCEALTGSRTHYWLNDTNRLPQAN